MKTTLLPLFALTAAFLLATPVVGAELVTASGDVTPFPNPNPYYYLGGWDVSGPLIIGNSGTGSLQLDDYGYVSDTSARVGNQAGSSGTVTINSMSTWDNTGDLYIGHSGTGQVLLSDGASLSSVDTSIGHVAGSSGSVTLNGSATSWSNSGDLYIGKGGSGNLTVEAGASVDTETLYTSMANLNLIGSSSYVSAHGVVLDFVVPGEKLRFDSTHGIDQELTVSGGGALSFNIDGTGSLGVGFRGAGEMEIKEAVKVSAVHGYLGMLQGSVGQGSVSDAGSEWNISGGLDVGLAGQGVLTVSNGGKVASAWGSLNGPQGNASTVTVTGTGSIWTNTYQLVVGDSGEAELTVQSGGRVESGSSLIGNQTTGTGAVTVAGTNSTWAVAGTLYVGNNGTGTLTVENGGAVTAKTLYTAMTNLHGNGTISVNGLVFDSSQEVVIDGTDSNTFGNGGALHLDMDGTGALGVGYKNYGDARIKDGAVVRSTEGYLGMTAGSGGSVNIAGPGTSWIISGNLTVGNNNNGEYSLLSINDGASVSSATASINSRYENIQSTVYVTGTNSTWTTTGAMIVGEDGHGLVQVQSGNVSAGNATLGKNVGSSGYVKVQSADAHWTINGSLVVGESGYGRLNISNGGSVMVGGTVTGGSSSDLEVEVGSTLTAASGLSSNGNVYLDGTFEGDVAILSNGLIHGNGTIEGNLSLASGAKIAFNLTSTLTVTGTVTMDSSFGIASLLGLDNTTPNGAYTIIDGTATDFAALGLQNWGIGYAHDLGGGKSAYFEQGSLVVQVIPEPGTSALLLLGLGAVLFAGTRRVRK